MTTVTDTVVADAIAQLKSFVRDADAVYRDGSGEYEFLSVRGVLYTLGFDAELADEVVYTIAERGFSYCLDPLIANPRTGERPTADVCYWGVDQLHSRLGCI